MEVLVFLQISVPVYVFHPLTHSPTHYRNTTSIHPSIHKNPLLLQNPSCSATYLPKHHPSPNHDRAHKIRFIHLHTTRRSSKLQCAPCR
ncbi:hypothetical protein B9Z19DRAFT_1092474 [Tuber borchii]|uniref:Uncharacterized protein n=1 Tax=Tuber borchii TaxID=42251 RepID=A0A2T6ZGI5_TUBBO|nr:hypothetical protein B9Z19DRAFT_1092474 [Tuber borchii]